MKREPQLTASQRDLLDRNIINIEGRVDNDTAEYVRDCIQLLVAKGSPAIEVWITSMGGLTTCGLHIYDLLSTYSGTKVGKVMCFAESVATVILQACDQRFICEHSFMLMHNLLATEVSLDVLRNPRRLARLTRNIERDQTLVENVYLRRVKMGKAQLLRLMSRDRRITATEAVRLGFADQILPPNRPLT